MIITITEVTQEFAKNGKEYLKVKGTTPDGKETTKSIFDNLKEAWPLMEVGAVLDFTMEKKGQYWNVVTVKPATAQTSTNAPASTTLAKEAVKLGAVPIPTGDEKVRSMSIAYAKDLVVAGKIELKDIKACADRFVAYILNIDRKEVM